jgi:Txe/YoeB family toxin of Txe-Axe toxin-antitoxin module
MSKKLDINLGLSNEDKAISQISEFLNIELIKDNNPYAIHDFYNKDKSIFVELKSRRINHNKFPTALIGENKIKKCNKPNVDYYFFWLYNDGLFYLKYNKELFDTMTIEKDYTIGLRKDVGRIEQSAVVHIPYKHLNKISNENKI